MYGNKIPEWAMNMGQQEHLLPKQDMSVPQTVLNRVSGTFYQARELSDEICQVADMLLGPTPNMICEDAASPTRGPGILNEIDDASDSARRQMERAFSAIKRLRAAL
jgi:hypothetical protein